MNINTALNNGVLGIQRGIEQAQRSAATIASADKAGSDNPASYAEPMVDLMVAQRQVEASALVVRTLDEMLGTIIDTIA